MISRDRGPRAAGVLRDGRSKLAQSRKMMSNKGLEPSELSTSGGAGLMEASRVGTDLRAARERLGWSVEECAGALRIRREYLAALENGRCAGLPGPAYAAGFLRSYGRALGLDPDDLV